MQDRIQALGEQVSSVVRDAGGRALAVGGWVRNRALGLASDDLDLDVYGLALDTLERLLRRNFGAIDTTGRKFGVFKIPVPGTSAKFDVSLPRRELKSGPGHKGFLIEVEPGLSPRDAASRRDVTVNAMSLDLLTDELVDPFDGMEDLRRRRLRAVDPARFPEDPLRVLRVASLAARFRLKPDAELLALCRLPDLAELPRERLFEELQRILLRAPKPSLAVETLRRADQLRHFPELEALVGVPENRVWHPEGTVYNHTLLAMNAAARGRTGDDREDLIVALSVLCHDLGKPATTRLVDGNVRALGHDEAGMAPTRSFLGRITAEPALIEPIVDLVREHLRPSQFFQSGARDPAIRRLATRVPIEILVRVARADHLGRSTREAAERRYPAGDWLLDRARALSVERSGPVPLLSGRHLIARGLEPGPDFRDLLRRAYEAQLDGRISSVDEALDYLGVESKS